MPRLVRVVCEMALAGGVLLMLYRGMQSVFMTCYTSIRSLIIMLLMFMPLRDRLR